MPQVEYREFEPADTGPAAEVLEEAFSLDRYVTAPSLRRLVRTHYVRSCLIHSTYAQVAVSGGRVVGVIMGRAAGQPPLPGRLGNRLRALGATVALLLRGRGHYRELFQFFRFQVVYSKLKRGHARNINDELVVFGVRESVRGQGVGHRLYSDLMRYFARLGRDDFFLYSDAKCTVSFYERQGMLRAGQTPVTTWFDDQPAPLDVYLYTGDAG